MTKLRRWLKRLAALFVSTLVACLLAELAVVTILGPQVRFPRHVVGAPFGMRINEPNSHYRHRSADVDVEFRINSKGMRSDVEYGYEKPPGKLRILSLGDSFAIGYEVQVEECFSSQLERNLIAKGYDVEVLNAGVSGYSNAEECLYLERELMKYDPDLVLISFYTNDIADNTRTRLFKIERGTNVLIQTANGYVPMGRLANFLNTNWLFSWLSENSSAFSLLKDKTTLIVKRRMAERRRAKFDEGHAEVASPDASPVESVSGERPLRVSHRLACAIFDRIFAGLREDGIPLVVQSIPHMAWSADGEPWLEDRFPEACFDFERDGVSLVTVGEALVPYIGETQLYYRRSNKHWTPFAHEIAGRTLADHIDELGLLTK